MCRSMVMRVVSARSTIGPSRWPRARWMEPNSPAFLARLSATSWHSASTARCTSSAWTGVMFEHKDKLVLAAVERAHPAIVLDPNAEVLQLVIGGSAGRQQLLDMTPVHADER